MHLVSGFLTFSAILDQIHAWFEIMPTDLPYSTNSFMIPTFDKSTFKRYSGCTATLLYRGRKVTNVFICELFFLMTFISVRKHRTQQGLH